MSMQPMILKTYSGKDPEDGSPTFMFGLHKPDTDELVACMAFADKDADSEALINNPEMFKAGCSVGVYALGDPGEIAHKFLAAPTTTVLGVYECQATEHRTH